MKKITPEEYLEAELASEIKHELIDGEVYAMVDDDCTIDGKTYAMAGAHANHERIALNLGYGFMNHLKGSPCEPFGSDMKVRVDESFFTLM